MPHRIVEGENLFGLDEVALDAFGADADVLRPVEIPAVEMRGVGTQHAVDGQQVFVAYGGALFSGQASDCGRLRASSCVRRTAAKASLARRLPIFPEMRSIFPLAFTSQRAFTLGSFTLLAICCKLFCSFPLVVADSKFYGTAPPGGPRLCQRLTAILPLRPMA